MTGATKEVEATVQELRDHIIYLVDTGRFDSFYDNRVLNDLLSSTDIAVIPKLEEFLLNLLSFLNNVDDIVYDGRNRKARRLADWVDDYREREKFHEIEKSLNEIELLIIEEFSPSDAAGWEILEEFTQKFAALDGNFLEKMLYYFEKRGSHARNK